MSSVNVVFFCRGFWPKCMQLTFMRASEEEDVISKKDYATVMTTTDLRSQIRHFNGQFFAGSDGLLSS